MYTVFSDYTNMEFKTEKTYDITRQNPNVQELVENLSQ